MGNRVLTNVIKLKVLGWEPPGFPVRVLNPGTGVLVRHRQRRRHGPVMMETETGRCGHKPRNAWSPQEMEEAGRLLPESLGRDPALQNLYLEFWPLRQ